METFVTKSKIPKVIITKWDEADMGYLQIIT